jgi:hypothetical protein
MRSSSAKRAIRLLVNLLDYWPVWSGTAPRKQRVRRVTATAIDETIKICLGEIRTKLDEATRLARAAEACVAAGSIAEGIEVSMDIEQLIFDAGRLHDAVSLMHRLTRT